ncbi:MAG: ABC transporter ATP-binding protein [Dehalococcoidales bacterium]|nr:ABC transporter ATP-binding protein [Dehalococcoidales bacterium]
MTQDAIVVENLSYHYGKILAVDHISFRVARQEILGFLGPNGAGKSTTVKVLTGQLRLQEGHATLLGMDIAQDIERVQARMGVCFEQPNLYEQMTALENLELFARLFDMKSFDGYALLKKVGLEGREKDRVANYSKGMKQRLMVARSLVNQAEILFLDEPTTGLDPVSADSIRNLILKERERGATVFLTTHDMWEADKLCDRVAFLNQGKIASLDTPHTLKQQYGQRSLVVEISRNGQLEERTVTLDKPETSETMRELFSREKVVTVHSQEATLEDIFLKVTGRRLTL